MASRHSRCTKPRKSCALNCPPLSRKSSVAFKERIIGIDLGTSNSCVAVSEFGKTIVVPNVEGGRTTPSIVYIDHSGSRLVGVPAKKRAIKYPERTVQSVKRYMGSNHRVQIDNTPFSPEQIAACILHKLKAQAEEYLNQPVSQAIITVPAYFDDAQRLATRHAGKLAGLEVLRVINEPTACALAYGFSKVPAGQETNIIIFDFGGGTFDVSILHISEGVVQVKATNGNNRLGGDDFDTRIAMHINDQVRKKYNVNPSVDPVARQRMMEAAEKVKIDLSGMGLAQVALPFLAVAPDGPVNLEMAVSLKEFNELTADLVKATAIPIETALADAKLTAAQIDNVVLVGGTTRIPAVQQFIRGYFNKEPAKTINPDEACAIGAAIQGGILSGDIEDLLLLDVIPMSLGVEDSDGGKCVRIIEKNTAIPTTRTHTFRTTKPAQTSLQVHVLQGEGKTVAGNISLARFEIQNIPRAPVGQAIDVDFHVDADGIFQCSYKQGDSKVQQVFLKRTSGYDQEQIEKLAKQEKAILEAMGLTTPELDSGNADDWTSKGAGGAAGRADSAQGSKKNQNDTAAAGSSIGDKIKQALESLLSIFKK